MKIENQSSAVTTPIREIIAPSPGPENISQLEISHQDIIGWQNIVLNDTLQLHTKVSSITKVSSSLEQLLRGQ